MSRKQKGLLVAGLVILALISAGLVIRHMDIPVLEPAGPVAQKERGLIITAFLLSMIVVIPVYVILVWFSLKYRHTNKSAKYDPGFSHSRWLEGVWWAVPLSIISILAVIAFKSSHDLDPFKPLASTNPTLKIQVVSMEWKWLFIYPDQGIASVNYVNFPVNTPVDFEITSDAPMNSFWIPQLGGQIYAMSGMSTSMNLMADKLGTYRGLSANISGDGFAGMHFAAVASTPSNYSKWLDSVRNSPKQLDSQSYEELAKPTMNDPPAYYALAQPGLFDSILSKYAEPVFKSGSGQ
jgi:cytochrome o ubiquinol oxidase subunit 2